MSQNYANIEFNPIQCTSKVFANLTAQEGFLYFVTDTKQMFLGRDGEFVNMCGGINIRYGKKNIEYENSGQAPDPNVVFQVEELDPQEAPLENDLILNSDGCFYKVNTVTDDSIATVRLTLQGTGGGFGGGGGGTGDGSSSYSINIVPPASIFAKEDEKKLIQFQGISSAETANYISRASLTMGAPEDNDHTPFLVQEGQFAIGTIENPVLHSLSLAPYQDLFDSKPKTVYLNTTDAYGATRNKKFSVQVVELTLGQRKETIFKSSENSYQYACDVSGATEGIVDKKVTFSIYAGDNIYGDPVIEPQVVSVASNFNGPNKIFQLNLEKLPHGVYTLKVQMTAKIAGSTQVIPSNILTHKLIRFVPGTQGALFAVSVPDSIEQYTNAYLDFMIASDEENKDYNVEIAIDGVAESPIITTTNTLTTKTLYFEGKGNYTLSATVVEMSTLTQTFSISVIEYTGKLPVIDPADPGLILYLTPKGRSNNAADRTEWKEYNGRHTAILSDFFFGDNSGWLEDATGTSYLQLASGGKLSLPTFYPFAEDPTKTSTTNSTMGYGMTIELDFEINGVTDYDAELISCVSKDSSRINKVGFSITGNKIQFYNSSKNGGDTGSLVNINLIEGKRIRLSFVIEPNDEDHPYPMFLTYINGIICGATIYDTQDSFVDSVYPAQLSIDSTNAQIKLYGIRVYSTKLEDSDILNNFTASLPTLEERQARFDSNNVYTLDEVDFENVNSEHYDLQIPIMAIVGGWGCDPEDKWKTLSADKVGEPALPTGKKDYRLIDVSVKYPKNEYFKGYKDYTYKNEYANGLGMADNFGIRPDNGGCIMYAQGTSSMEYPVKNLRLRWKKDKYFYTVRPDIAPVEIICMKADYMESSGSHNTGAANLVDDLYSRAKLKSPGQRHFGPDPNSNEESIRNRKTIVTCIKGHPCLIFWSKDGTKGSYQYIGKYNLNLDKATPEPFGFDHDDSDFGYLKPGDKYYAIQYDDDGDKFIGQEKPADGGDYDDTKDGEELKEVQEGEKINSIHCFEFLDNAVPVCNFLRKPKTTGGEYNYEETWYNGFEVKGEIVPGWTLGFESRYPEDRVGYHDADMLYPFASWLSELYYLKTEGSRGDGKATQNDIDLANARFKNEYQAYLNKDFLLFYYIVTEALLMADSRVKNMMIATWGKEEEFSYYPLAYKENTKYVYAGTVGTVDWDSGESYYRLENGNYILAERESDAEDYEFTIVYTQVTLNEWIPDTTQEAENTHFYKWYPIFYDMDTMLGLDNTGVNRFNYYDEDDDPSTYNGDEVLWNFVRDNLSLELDAMFNKLESAGLNINLTESGAYRGDSVIPYFNNNQANMANEAFYNGDAQYKYIRPAISGYWDGLNNVQINPGEAPYLYAAQGDRTLEREYFITNRMKFLRGKHGSNNFQTNDRITFRLYYPTGQEANFTDQNGVNHSASIDYVPPSDTFDFESLQTCYAGVLIGANGIVTKERFNGEESKSITVPEARSANGTEAYLLGIDNLKDLGDLSNKYPQKFIMSGKNKLRSLTFGNPHKEYYNPFWRPKEGTSTPIGLSGCTFLETFNLQNCSTYNAGIDFRNCPVIETILLTGSNTSNINLPVNGALRELRLPTSITKLTIDSHRYLSTDFSIGTYRYGSDNRIGGNGEYVDDFTYLTELTIIDTPIDSYNMVSKASNLEAYYFKGFNWEIKGTENDNQYINTKDTYFDTSKTYYIWNPDERRYTKASSEQFDNDWVAIKEKHNLVVNGKIERIPILDYLHSKKAMKSGISVHPESALTGTITIKAAAKVNEFEIYKTYHGTYPNVQFEYDEQAIGSANLTKAHKIEFYNVPNINENTEAYYTVLTDGSLTMKELISASGPAGAALRDPTMQSTNDTNYIFTGKWKVVDLNKPNANPIIYDMNTSEFDNLKPSSHMKLEPIYEEEDRIYRVTFYDYGTPPAIHKTVGYTYQQVMSSNAETPMFLNKPDDEDLPSPYHRYSFKGWISEKDYKNLADNPNPDIIDLETKVITAGFDNVSLYPHYEPEDARLVPSDLKYFEIVTANLNLGTIYFDPNNESTPTGPAITLSGQKVIRVKDIYRATLSGKITLPNKDASGNVITVVDLCNDNANSNIKEVYFLKDHKYTSIGYGVGNTGFCLMKNLEKVYFPEDTKNSTLKYLSASAFQLCSNLTTIENLPDTIEYIGERCFRNDTYLALEKLPENLTFLGTEAFSDCRAVAFEKLPVGLTTIFAKTFAGCTAIKINHFGHNTSNIEMGALENNMKYITLNAFASQYYETAKAVNQLYIYNSIKHIGSGAFVSFGAPILTVYDESGLITDENSSAIFGKDITLEQKEDA